MKSERDEFIALIIANMSSLWEVITLEKQIPSDLRITIGMLADKARERLLSEMEEPDAKKIAPDLNVHPKTIKSILERLGKKQP